MSVEQHRLLVVEDNKILRMMVVMLLKEAGYEVVEAENREQAETLIRSQTFSTILLDGDIKAERTQEEIESHKNDGEIVADCIMASQNNRDTPIINISNMYSNRSAEEWLPKSDIDRSHPEIFTHNVERVIQMDRNSILQKRLRQ